MKFPLLALASLLVAPLAAAQAGDLSSPSEAFGAPGFPVFHPYALPEDLENAHGAGEPTIGIPWDTDHVFFQAFANTHRATFTGNDTDTSPSGVAWDDVTPLFTVTNVDPMLHADPITNRIFAGGLAGPCSLMGFSDDDGATWIPAGNMCSGAQFDHQSIGSGPWADTPVPRQAVYPHATYYCAQLRVTGNDIVDMLPGTACATSLDGGVTWLPPTEVLGGCGGLHGHIAVSPSGFAALPFKGCFSGEGVAPTGEEVLGIAYTADNGLTWMSRIVPGSVPGPAGGFDPGIAFSQQSGWLWFSQGDEQGLFVAMSKDNGVTWETLGNATSGADPAQWLNLSAAYRDPMTDDPIRFAAFPDVVAGDDLRAAIAFLGTTDPEGEHPFDDCSEASDANIWHYYVALTLDGGQQWTVERIWEDPVQVGAIWDGGGGEPCRNLLDFNDADLDSKGRIHIALADGCTDACAEAYEAWLEGGDPPTGTQSRDALGVILRQATGPSLFAASDAPAPPAPPAPTPQEPEDEPQPAAGVALVGLALLAAAFMVRRKA